MAINAFHYFQLLTISVLGFFGAEMMEKVAENGQEKLIKDIKGFYDDCAEIFKSF